MVQANPWARRSRVQGKTTRARGTCPVCRGTNLALQHGNGKMMPHGKTAANPRGCPGNGQAPLRSTAGTMRPGVAMLPSATAAAAEPRLVIRPKQGGKSTEQGGAA